MAELWNIHTTQPCVHTTFLFSGRLRDGPSDGRVNSRHGCASISGVMMWEPEGFACFLILMAQLNPRLWWLP